MSRLSVSSPPGQRRRADAERSIAAILDAAVGVLSDRPDASMEEIAKAAGVARQTVYAHYPSREELLSAVGGRALAQAVADFEAAEPERGTPVEALDRLVGSWWQTVARHARLLEAMRGSSAEEVHAFHAPILERLERFVRRGRRAGDFDREQPLGWQLASFLALMHAAADEVAAGRISPEEAEAALRRSVPRLLGVERG
jgi:AcrR family transcriptional regulator